MDIEGQPLNIFIREAMLKTPQGWVVLISFIMNWTLVLLTLTTKISFIVPDSGTTLIYLVILPWPFIVLLTFISLSSPKYYAHLLATIITAGIAVIPYWWLYV